MLVRNSTGKVQVISWAGRLRLDPGVWVEVPKDTALRLHRHKIVDLELSNDITEYLWQLDGKTHLLWMSPFAIDDGYASAAEQYVLALTNAGMEVYPQSCWWSVMAGLHKQTVALLGRGASVPLRVGLCMATPSTFPELRTPYRIGLTMYEASDPLKYRPDWKAGCDSVDMLIVPSAYCKEIFSFFPREIAVVPIIINPTYNQPVRRTAKDTFTFGMHGTLTGRKSPLEALEYFKAAFPKSQYPDVRLEFKTRLNILGQGEGRIPDVGDDRVRVHSGTWAQKRVLEWLYGLDAYIFPTKGEGFGMPPREALATGLPTMFTNCSGLKDMANGRYDFPIPVDHLEDCPLGGYWAVPDRDFCIDTMRWMYNNRESAYDKGYKGGVWYGNKWGREAIALRMKQVIENIDPTTAIGFTGDAKRVAVESPMQHREFYDRVVRAAGRTGLILDFGFGDGMLCEAMLSKGYKVVVVAEVDDVDRVKNIIQDNVPQYGVRVIPFDLSKHNAAYLMSQLTETVKCCASQGFLQLSVDSDIIKCIELMTMISKRFVFSIPSDNYPGQYPMGGRVHSMENVQDLLRGIPAERGGYGLDKRYIYVDITRR